MPLHPSKVIKIKKKVSEGERGWLIIRYQGTVCGRCSCTLEVLPLASRLSSYLCVSNFFQLRRLTYSHLSCSLSVSVLFISARIHGVPFFHFPLFFSWHCSQSIHLTRFFWSWWDTGKYLCICFHTSQASTSYFECCLFAYRSKTIDL